MSKTQFKDGYFHLVRCLNDKEHFFETSGAWYLIDEVRCIQHQYIATVLQANLRRYDWEISGLPKLKR